MYVSLSRLVFFFVHNFSIMLLYVVYIVCVAYKLVCFSLQKRKEQLLSIDINQKLGLCHALLELGDWGGATNLMKLLPPLLPVWSLPVTKSICSLVHLSIEPVYRRLCTFSLKFFSN